MKRYKKYMVLVLALLFAACLPINSIASEWEIESPWKKVGTNTTLAVPTDNVGIGMEIPNNRLQVIELINFNNPIRGTLLGFQAGRVNTGSDNSFIGFNAGFSNTTGFNNTFTGSNAGLWNTIGGSNTFTGVNAGFSNTTGNSNTFTGVGAGFSNTSGGDNTFTGVNTGRANTTGGGNTFIGREAGRTNTTGSSNTFTGMQVGFSNTIGVNNTFTGLQAGFSNTTGNSNTFTGVQAGVFNTTGLDNTFTGVNAGRSNTTGISNTFTGTDAGRSNATGNQNTFTGLGAGFSNTTGSFNTFTGLEAGRANTTGVSNTFTGANAGISNTSGESNTFTGLDAGRFNTRGNFNTFVGVDAGRFNITGSSNTSIGSGAGRSNDTGNFNTFLGRDAGLFNITGSNNIFTGMNAGLHLADGFFPNTNPTNSVFIGNNTRSGAIDNNNEIVIGANAIGSGSNTITLGNTSIVRTITAHLHTAGTTRGLGGAQILVLPTPGAPTVTPQGVLGTTTWGYRITARSSVGETLASTAGTTTTGNAILSATNFNRITWLAVFGAVDYRIYRTTAGGTPLTTGLIGTTTLLAFNDTGLAASTAVPTIDSSVNVGIGTATPAVGNRLEVHDGHIVNTMTTPPHATCNIGIPSIIGTDMGGAITTPATATACTITFTIPWNEIYACVVSGSTSTAAPFVSALSATAATFTYVTTGTPILYYHCSGR